MSQQGNGNVGFIGFVDLYVTPFGFELGSHWLSDYFLGRIKVPRYILSRLSSLFFSPFFPFHTTM
jgi:hypothetical protein